MAYRHPNNHPQDSDLVELDNNNQLIGLYGYPHKDLIKVMTAKKIILGGDHIFPNSRIWQCINAKCKIAFPVFPYNNIAENLRVDMCNQHKKSAKR